MNFVQGDQVDQVTAQSDALSLTCRQQQVQEISGDDDATGSLKEEALEADHDSDITSENLSELPPNLLAKIANGKRIYGACVRKQCQGVTIYLLDNNVWQIFCAEGNEMIITKKGRRMFPVPVFMICDLEPEKLYELSLEVNAVDNHVYKYTNGKWIPTKEGSCLYPTPVPGRNSCLHHNSPNTGLYWMNEPVSFATMKISNNLDARQTIVLQSMRKYVMVLIIGEMKGRAAIRIRLPETVFVAVTQYQNDNITKMKIEHNPFANAFRMSSGKRKDKGKAKRRQLVEADSEDEDKPQEVSSTNQTISLPGQLHPDNMWNLTRPDIWCNDALQMSAYLEQRRQMFQNLLLPGSDRLNLTSPQMDLSTNNNLVNWPPVVPPHMVGQSLYTSPQLPEMPLDGRFMFPLQGANPLAEVRQFGELNQCSDVEVPLSLVKKITPQCNMLSKDGNPSSKPRNFRQSPMNKRHLPRHFQNEEPISHLQIQLPAGHELNETHLGLINAHRPYSRLVPEMGTVPLFSGDGLLQGNSLVKREDVTGHNREMPHQKHGKFVDSKEDCYPAMSAGSWRSVDIENTLPETEGDATHLMVGRNYNTSLSQYISPALMKPEVILRNGHLWSTTNEVVVSSNGRPMFPFISLSVNKLHPNRQYSISLRMVLGTNFIYNYNEHEWVPTIPASGESRDAIYPHPDNPKYGRQWGSEVNFDRLRLSCLRQGKNVLKLQLRRQYLPHVILETDAQLWKFPLKDAVFISVGIDRSCYLTPIQNVQTETSGPERLSENLASQADRQQGTPTEWRGPDNERG